jgi:hypothetical protein
MAKKPPFTVSDAGRLGGRARANNLTKEQRSEIARRAAESRWAPTKESIGKEIQKHKKEIERLERQARKLGTLDELSRRKEEEK